MDKAHGKHGSVAGYTTQPSSSQIDGPSTSDGVGRSARVSIAAIGTASGRTWAQVVAGAAGPGPSQQLVPSLGARRSALLDPLQATLVSSTGTGTGTGTVAKTLAKTVAATVAGKAMEGKARAKPQGTPVSAAALPDFDQLLVACGPLLPAAASPGHALAALVQALASVPLAQLPGVGLEVLERLRDECGFEDLPATLAQARAAMDRARRPALAVLACIHALLAGGDRLSDREWDTLLASYLREKAPEAHLGARMLADPMAVFTDESIPASRQLELLDAVYAIPGLVSRRFILGSFVTAWGVAVTPELRQHLLDQLMRLGKAWVQPGHARMNRAIVDADYRCAQRPMPTSALEQVQRWYEATWPGARWGSPQQQNEFLDGEVEACQHTAVADTAARDRLVGWLRAARVTAPQAPRAEHKAQPNAEQSSPPRAPRSLDDDEA